MPNPLLATRKAEHNIIDPPNHILHVPVRGIDPAGA